MKLRIAVITRIVAIALPLFAMAAEAADSKTGEKTLTPQQSKMAACAKENKGLKGAEYKKARKECMSRPSDGGKSDAKEKAKPAKPAKTAEAEAEKPAHPNKMAACSKENKGLKGDEYKQAQKECLAK